MPYAVGQLGLCAKTIEPVPWSPDAMIHEARVRVSQQEKPLQ